MVQLGLGSYVSGLTNMASSMSLDIGPSFVEADCFDLDNYLEDFLKYYEIKDNNIKLVESNSSLKDIFYEFFGENKKIISSLTYWIELHFGKYEHIYTVEEAKLYEYLSRSDGGVSSFYIVEDLYFVEFSDKVLCFMIGNNE